MVRKFLYFFAFLIVLFIAGAIALSIWSKEATQLAFVPSADFVEQTPLEENAYNDPSMWFSRPGIGIDDPARWQPAVRGEGRTLPAPADAQIPDFAVFFVHPTSYIERAQWNAPLDDARANRIAQVYLKGMASPFNRASEIWAPKYRQATMGAFLTDAPEAQRALDAAYADVEQAFEFFRASVDPGTPIVLAGHSQGALHLLRLLQEEVKGTDLASRVAAIYIVGWPISIERDLPSLGFPACATAGQTGCIMSWSSFAEPADPGDLVETFETSRGYDGQPRRGSNILCTNPITGTIGGNAPASDNLGTLVPDEDLANGELVPGSVPARCSENGILLIGDPPQMGSAVLPGNNYHVYDIPLFWRNLQEDVTRRVETWAQQTS